MSDLNDEFVRHHRAAFGWALVCCRWDRAVAEDVLQTAYLKVLDGRAQFGGQSEFRKFFFSVIRRTARDEARRRLIRATIPFPLFGRDDALMVPPAGPATIERDEATRRLMVALESLSRRQREVLHLVFYQDLTIAAAAEVLGVSVGAARVHYERGKAQLRRILGKE